LVEDPAGVDHAVEHVGEQFLDVGAGRGYAAGEGDVAQENPEVRRNLRECLLFQVMAVPPSGRREHLP